MSLSTRFLLKLPIMMLVLATRSAGAMAGGDATDFRLSNGLRVHLVPIAGEKQVVVLLGVRAGFFDEPAGFPHLAHVTEHIIVFGAPPGTDEGQAVERWFKDGRANAETLPGWMYFDIRVETTELDLALRVQAFRLSRFEMTDDLLAREVPRTLAELEYLETSDVGGTGKFAYSAFVQAALYGQPEVPIKAKTRTIAVEDVRRFHDRMFRPNRAILCLVGGFDTDRAREAIEKWFGAIPKPAPSPGLPPPHPMAGSIIARWDAATSHLILAWRTPPASSPEHAALSLASVALMQRLATNRDIAPMARMPLVTNDVEGYFLLNVQAKPGADPEALKAKLLDQVGRISTPEGFSALQVSLARQALLREIRPGGLRALMLALGGTRLMDRTNQELPRLGRAFAWGDLEEYAGRVEALDGTKVCEAVARHLAPESAIVVRVEPPK